MSQDEREHSLSYQRYLAYRRMEERRPSVTASANGTCRCMEGA